MVGFFLSFFYSSFSCFSFLFALFPLPHFVATITMLKGDLQGKLPFPCVFVVSFLKFKHQVWFNLALNSNSKFKFASTRLSILVQGKGLGVFCVHYELQDFNSSISFQKRKTLKSSQALFSSLFCNK